MEFKPFNLPPLKVEGTFDLTEYGKALLKSYSKTEEELWRGFTATVAIYATETEKALAVNMFNQMAEKKPHANVNGRRFRLASIKLVEETPTSGRVIAEYVREQEEKHESNKLD